MEEEINNQLAFLDVQVAKLEDGKIRTTKQPPRWSQTQLRRTLFQRVHIHCSDDSGRKEEIEYLHALFKANGYPKSFIRKCLRKRHPERSDGEKPEALACNPLCEKRIGGNGENPEAFRDRSGS
nr:unnamed protein product [Spirometra erinaceieuropaei]